VITSVCLYTESVVYLTYNYDGRRFPVRIAKVWNWKADTVLKEETG